MRFLVLHERGTASHGRNRVTISCRRVVAALSAGVLLVILCRYARPATTPAPRIDFTTVRVFAGYGIPSFDPWSPDGRSFVLRSPHGLAVARIDSLDVPPREILSGPFGEFVWSPDGTRLAVVCNRRGQIWLGKRDVFVVSTTGKLDTLVSAGEVMQPVWSDAQTLLVHDDRDGHAILPPFKCPLPAGADDVRRMESGRPVLVAGRPSSVRSITARLLSLDRAGVCEEVRLSGVPLPGDSITAADAFGIKSRRSFGYFVLIQDRGMASAVLDSLGALRQVVTRSGYGHSPDALTLSADGTFTLCYEDSVYDESGGAGFALFAMAVDGSWRSPVNDAPLAWHASASSLPDWVIIEGANGSVTLGTLRVVPRR
jgi:hypothetical protein